MSTLSSVLNVSDDEWLNTVHFLETFFDPETEVVLEGDLITIGGLTEMVRELSTRSQPFPLAQSALVQDLYLRVCDALQTISRLPKPLNPPTQIEPHTRGIALPRTGTLSPGRAAATREEDIAVAHGCPSTPDIHILTPTSSPLSSPPSSPLSSPPSSPPRTITSEYPAANEPEVDALPTSHQAHLPISVTLRLPPASAQESTSKYSHTRGETSKAMDAHSLDSNPASNSDCTDNNAQGIKAVDIDSGAESELTTVDDTTWKFTIRKNANGFVILDTSEHPCNGGDNFCRWGGCRQTFETWVKLRKHLSRDHGIVFKHSEETEKGGSSSSSGQSTTSQAPQLLCQWFNGACPNTTHFEDAGSLGRHIHDHRFFLYCPDPACPPNSALTIARKRNHYAQCQNRHLLKVAYEIAEDVDVNGMTNTALNKVLKNGSRSAVQEFHQRHLQKIREKFAEEGQEYRF